MAATPNSFGQLDELLDQDLQTVRPTLTYGYNRSLNRIMGMIDGKDASYQAFAKIFSTVRYETPIYDWRYGHELENVLGKSKPYAKVEIERMLREAASQDDRFVSMDDFTVLEEKVDSILVRVTINTITMPYIYDLEVPW